MRTCLAKSKVMHGKTGQMDERISKAFSAYYRGFLAVDKMGMHQRYGAFSIMIPPRQCMNCIFQISSTEESAGKLHESLAVPYASLMGQNPFRGARRELIRPPALP
jgi:hypothetical protein